MVADAPMAGGGDDASDAFSELATEADTIVSPILVEQGVAERLDLDDDGVIMNAEVDKAHTRDRLDKELDRIRDRRVGDRRGFPRDFADWVLISGLIIGVLYWGLIFATTSGLFMSDSVGADQSLSGTILDPGEKCLDNSANIWINIWVDEEQRIRVSSHNINESIEAALLVSLTPDLAIEPITTEASITKGSPSLVLPIADSRAGELPFPDGEYELLVELFDLTDMNATISNLTNRSDPFQDQLSGRGMIADIKAHAVISTHRVGIFSDLTEKKAEVEHEGVRSCWTTQDLGKWGIALMVAEWGGGRETAMLAGGSAGVPPWWMATVSLMMSVFFLFVQYPLMYRFYHRDTDDIMSGAQLKRLIKRTLTKASARLHLEIDMADFKHQEREISIDVIVPYRITHRSYSTPPEIKTAFIHDILEEFAIFGEMRPLQLKAHPLNPHGGSADDLATGIDGAETPEISADNPMLVDDYTSFFEDLNTYARIEDAVRDCLKQYFKQREIERKGGTAVMSDDDAVFIRVIYRPAQRFAFFRYKKTHLDVEKEIREHVASNLAELLGDREVIVSASNEVQTLADRAAAGRVEENLESKSEKAGEHQAYVAKQAGIAGTLLQNQFVGDILSSVEYVAHENRARIDRWGFFGLIVFVWIPFMASGVLVGAMLGLVARMKFERVLAACLIGGTAASITWAYTARGIIEFMERYHAEAAIPVVIGVIVVLAFMHVRTNKRRRKEALFSETLEFFTNTASKERAGD